MDATNIGDHVDHSNNSDRKRKISYWVKRIMQSQTNTSAPTTTATNGTTSNNNNNNNNNRSRNKQSGNKDVTHGLGMHPRQKNKTVGIKQEPTQRTKNNKESTDTVPSINIKTSKPVRPSVTKVLKNPQVKEGEDKVLQKVSSSDTDMYSDNDSCQSSNYNSDNFSTTGVISIKTRKSEYSNTPHLIANAPTQLSPFMVASTKQEREREREEEEEEDLRSIIHAPQPTQITFQDTRSIKSTSNATITSNNDTINSSIAGIPPASIMDRNRTNTATSMSIASQSVLNYQPITTGAGSVFSGNVTGISNGAGSSSGNNNNNMNNYHNISSTNNNNNNNNTVGGSTHNTPMISLSSLQTHTMASSLNQTAQTFVSTSDRDTVSSLNSNYPQQHRRNKHDVVENITLDPRH